ncbi:MAG: MipA/OmpV family protein [Pseudomonadota bacterium]
MMTSISKKYRRSWAFRYGVLATFFVAAPFGAAAQDNRQIPGYQGDADSRADNVTGKPWSFIIGAGFGIGPLTDGSGDTELIPLPLFNVTYRDFFYIDALDGIGISPVSTETTFVSIDANFATSRSADDDRNSFLNDGDFERFAGLGDVDGDVAIEVYASHLFFDVVEASISATREFGDVDGWQVAAGLASGVEIGSGLFVGVEASTTWSSGNYSRAFFGVTQAQADDRLAVAAINPAVEPYGVFNAGAGLTDVSVGVGAFKAFGQNDRFFATLEAGYSFALGDLRDSPITERTITPGGSFSLGWRF